MRTVVVLNGGPGGVEPLLPVDLPEARLLVGVVAADSGLHLAAPLGLRVDAVVGDLDSVDEVVLAQAETAGAAVHRHPVDKDVTDLELAMARAVALGPDRVLVVGPDGGRLDHLLGTVAVLASDRWSTVVVDARLGAAALHVVRGTRALRTAVGGTVSLFAVGGPALGVRTTGLRWALDDEVLDAGGARGVSNVATAAEVVVDVAEGCVVVVRPDDPGRTPRPDDERHHDDHHDDDQEVER